MWTPNKFLAFALIIMYNNAMLEFRKKLKAHGGYFDPTLLQKLLKQHRKRLALLVVDVQKLYTSRHCQGTPRTEKLAERIQDAAQKLRKAKIPVYAIRMEPAHMSMDEMMNVDNYHFNHFVPEKHDVIVTKHSNSAFDTDLAHTLRRQGRHMLLVCGFNRSACVHETAKDASLQNFNVCVLRDLTDDNNAARRNSSMKIIAEKMLEKRVYDIHLPTLRQVTKILGLR